MTEDDRDLRERVQALDSQALGELYDRYSPLLYLYSVRLLRTADLAEECVAETFSRLLQALKNGHGPREHLRAYLYRIAHNWITDRWRRAPPPMLCFDDQCMAQEGQDPEFATLLQLEREQVRRALASLTPDQRQVLVLKYVQDLENDEIAIVLDKPVGAVKSLQHRGLAALRRALACSERNTNERA